MGREIKRVALDFDWPIGKVWEGFVNPYYHKCPQDGKTCFRGYTAAARWLQEIVGVLLTIGAAGSRKDEYTRARIATLGFGPRSDDGTPLLPPQELTDFVTRLVGHEPDTLFGYSTTDQWDVVGKLVEMVGLGARGENGLFLWGTCPVCRGTGLDPAYDEQRNAWTPTPPPAGDGWQVWETVSDGSPVSPVFATKEDLVAWLVNVDGRTRENAEAFVESGWVPSFLAGPHGVKCGIDCAADLQKK